MRIETAKDILEFLRQKQAQAARMQRGVIIQPGAIGDCILTLPLAEFMKTVMRLVSIDFLGHTEYTAILPGRTCIDGTRSIDSLGLHRLFVKHQDFELRDGDPLIHAFANYEWIMTFLGESHSDFEKNLIFTANCSHSAEVVTLEMNPPRGYSGHVSLFYIEQLLKLNILPELQDEEAMKKADLASAEIAWKKPLIKITGKDKDYGRGLLKNSLAEPFEKLVIIQPGSGGTEKSWHIDNYCALAAALQEKHLKVIFLLGPAEIDRYKGNTLRKIKKTAPCISGLSLTEALCVVSCADYFFGNDSGITHLAGAMGIRTTSLFGPSDPRLYRPLGPNVKIFQVDPAEFRRTSPELHKQLIEQSL